MFWNLFGSSPDFGEVDWVLAGLGNPGLKYSSTRHNLGFMAVDRLIDEFEPERRLNECNSDCFMLQISDAQVLAAKPQSMMNLSGGPVSCLMEKCDSAELLVISDDIHLDLGRLRARDGGSAGGHNGLQNIIDRLGTRQFKRLKLGCGPAPAGVDLAEFVLSDFAEDEWPEVGRVLDRARDLVVQFIEDGFRAQTVSG